jgi:predicted RNA methylase
MARLQAVAQALYYPTPPRVAAAIARHLVPVRRSGGAHTFRALDPCAGTGEPLAVITRSLGAETYGIEIHEQRAEEARHRLDRVLHTSAFTVRLSNGAFSLLFCNPPYDDAAEGRRLEHAFLTAMTRALAPGGVLVFLVPQRQLARSARYLAGHYHDFRAYRFPDPEFARFGQVVLFAVRKPQPGADAAAQAQLDAWAGAALAPLPDEPPPGATATVPPVRRGDLLFATLFFDSAEAAQEARRRGVWTQAAFAEQVWPPDEQPIRPLMPLRKGHLAQLIAAGLLNNLALYGGGQRLLVKGSTRKELVPVETADEHTTIEREVLRTTVVTLDLDTGAFEVIEDGRGAARPAPSSRAPATTAEPAQQVEA